MAVLFLTGCRRLRARSGFLALGGAGAAGDLVFRGVFAEVAADSLAGACAIAVDDGREVVAAVAQRGEFVVDLLEFFQDGVEFVALLLELHEREVLELEVFVGSPDFQDQVGTGEDIGGGKVGGHRSFRVEDLGLSGAESGAAS
jgi:hypothetical protein